jgi:site-specific recombinase XerD
MGSAHEESHAGLQGGRAAESTKGRRTRGAERLARPALRHTYGSHLATRGVPLEVIQELRGYATIDMTIRHAHLSPHMHREAVGGA